MGDKFLFPRVEKKEKYPIQGWRLVSHPDPDCGFLHRGDFLKTVVFLSGSLFFESVLF